MKLYDFVLSANCYKVRLLLGFLGVSYDSEVIDFHPGKEHKGEAFRLINPLGHIPVLDDDGYVLRDAHAILVYLASRYDPGRSWYPVTDPERLGSVAQWMAFADATASTASATRLHVNLGYDFDVDERRAAAHELFRVADEHLWFGERTGNDWFVPGPLPTLADVAVFPDVVLAEEGGIDLMDYPSLVRWTGRVKQIPGFSVMPGVFPFERA